LLAHASISAWSSPLQRFTKGETRNEKRFKALALAASLALIAAPASAQENVRWGVPMAFGSNLTALGDTMPWVSETLKKISGGTINLQVFEPGKLVPALAIFDTVSAGKAEAGYSWMGYELGKVPASALFGAVPFGMETPQFAAWMYFGGGDALLKEVYKPHNVYPIFCGSISPEAAGWFRKEIKTPADLNGLKFRAAGYGGKVYQKLGASVTVLPGGELFQALEKGVLDGTEFSLPTVDDQLGFYKVAQYYYMPGWHQPSTNQYLYVNLAPGTSSSHKRRPRSKPPVRLRLPSRSPRPRRCRALSWPSSRRKGSRHASSTRPCSLHSPRQPRR
jgi:TRAP-type mannitol/chloroaromatic compound transport system substrate-binding protein